MDLAPFWDCHRRAFAHFSGVPGAIVYDRAKTLVKRHVAPRVAVPLHPEAAAFAEHYDFVIDVLAAYRPTREGPGRADGHDHPDHVIAGRRFGSITELDGVWQAWIPIERGQVYRAHGQVVTNAAADRKCVRLVRAVSDLTKLVEATRRPAAETRQQMATSPLTAQLGG